MRNKNGNVHYYFKVEFRIGIAMDEFNAGGNPAMD